MKPFVLVALFVTISVSVGRVDFVCGLAGSSVHLLTILNTATNSKMNPIIGKIIAKITVFLSVVDAAVVLFLGVIVRQRKLLMQYVGLLHNEQETHTELLR